MEEKKAPTDGKNRSFEAVPQDRLYSLHKNATQIEETPCFGFSPCHNIFFFNEF